MLPGSLVPKGFGHGGPPDCRITGTTDVDPSGASDATPDADLDTRSR